MVALIYFPSTVAPVSSTVLGLTSVFGMGTGISPARSSTTIDTHDQIISRIQALTIDKHAQNSRALLYKAKC